MAWQQQCSLKQRCPPRFDKTQVGLLVGPVDLVADYRVPEGGQMDTNLMGSPRLWNCSHDAELPARWRRGAKSAFDAKFCDRGRSFGMNHLL